MLEVMPLAGLCVLNGSRGGHSCARTGSEPPQWGWEWGSWPWWIVSVTKGHDNFSGVLCNYLLMNGGQDHVWEIGCLVHIAFIEVGLSYEAAALEMGVNLRSGARSEAPGLVEWCQGLRVVTFIQCFVHIFPVNEQGARQCLSDRCLVHFALIEGVTTMAWGAGMPESLVKWTLSCYLC